MVLTAPRRGSSSSTSTPVRLFLPRLHPTQLQIKAEARRFNVLCSGRRSGKNVLGIDRLTQTSLEGWPTAWFAPSYKYLAESWRDLKRVLQPAIRDKSEQEHRLELVSGGVVECWSLVDNDPARGRKYGRVVIDEAAMVKDLLGVWHEAIRPTLADYAGDAWFLSTPKGLNDFHTLFDQGQDPIQAEWQSWKYPTACNPYINPDEIEAARQSSTERVFAQEWLAEFIGDGTGIFRGVQLASVLPTAPRSDNHHYVAGVDWGKLNDFTVISVLDECCRKQVFVDRFNRIDYAFQVQRLKTVCDTYRPRIVICEKNSIGEPLLENLARLHVPVYGWGATNTSKTTMIEALSLGIERGSLGLLNDPTQIAELLAYDAERLPGGMLRYGAPSGLHDDMVIALGLAWLAVVTPSPRTVKVRFGPKG